MSKPQVIVLGIDGIDFDYTVATLPELPNIKRLFKEGTSAPFKSVFPPDAIPSWITCYTGKDPSEHGILQSINYFAKGANGLNVDTSTFKGITFWDVIGNAGHTVCVINPFMAYPVWPVNGLMVNGPVFIDGKVEASSPDLVKGLDIPQRLGGIVDFPTKKTMKNFIKKVFDDTAEQADFGISALTKLNPDFYFQTFLTMDRIQHSLWRFCDPTDPTYPGPNPHKGVTKYFYINMDEIIERFLKVMKSDAKLVVISDHWECNTMHSLRPA